MDEHMYLITVLVTASIFLNSNGQKITPNSQCSETLDGIPVDTYSFLRGVWNEFGRYPNQYQTGRCPKIAFVFLGEDIYVRFSETRETDNMTVSTSFGKAIPVPSDSPSKKLNFMVCTDAPPYFTHINPDLPANGNLQVIGQDSDVATGEMILHLYSCRNVGTDKAEYYWIISKVAGKYIKMAARPDIPIDFSEVMPTNRDC